MESLIGKNWKTTTIPAATSGRSAPRPTAGSWRPWESNGGIYISTDSGASWTPYQVDGQDPLVVLGERSADGSKVMAGEWDGYIYIGTLDNGSWTWTKTSPKTNEETGIWATVALSRDGSTTVAVDLGGDVYIRTSSDQLDQQQLDRWRAHCKLVGRCESRPTAARR